MSALATLTEMTARQLLGARRVYWMVLLSLAPGALFLLISGNISAGGLTEAFVGINVGLFFLVVVPVISLLMATSALGDERRDATLSFVVLRPLSRYWIAAAKLAGAFVTAAVVVAVGAIALGAAMGIRSGDWSFVVPTIVGATVATGLYVAVFVPVGYLLERATLVGFAYIFIWESAVAGTLPGLAATSIWRTGFSAFLGLTSESIMADVPDFAVGDLSPGAGGAVLKLLVGLLLSVLVTGRLLQRRDLI